MITRRAIGYGCFDVSMSGCVFFNWVVIVLSREAGDGWMTSVCTVHRCRNSIFRSELAATNADGLDKIGSRPIQASRCLVFVSGLDDRYLTQQTTHSL